jgi:hypothetical protein
MDFQMAMHEPNPYINSRKNMFKKGSKEGAPIN